MKSEVTKKTSTDTTLKVTVDQAALAPHVKAAFDKLRRQVKAPGFRPGKAPDHIVEREIGSQAIQNEVLEHAVMHSYADAVKQHELPVIASPEVSIAKFVPYTDLEYTATVDILPKIELTDYKNLKLKRPEVKVEPKEVDQVVDDLRKRLAVRTSVKRAAEMGDEVNIDFDGSRDGQPVTGASSKSYDLLLGSGAFIPGFEEYLVGGETGQTKEFDITFPKDYQSTDLAGQKVQFKVVINNVSQVQLPEADAKFVSQVSPHQTVEDLKADISDRIKTEKAEAGERQFEQTVMDHILEKSKLSLPARLVEQQTSRIRHELEQRIATSGLDMDKYLKLAGKTAEQLSAEMKPEAEKRVGLALILTEIARAENLKVDPGEIEAELARLKQSYPDREMQVELDRPETREEIYNHLLASKTIAKVLSYIKE